MVASVFFWEKKLQLYVFNPIFRAEDDSRVSFIFLFTKKASALGFQFHFSSCRWWSFQSYLSLYEESLSFMFSAPFFVLKMMVLSVFFFSLRKKLQLYIFNSIFQAVDDGRVSFILKRKKEFDRLEAKLKKNYEKFIYLFMKKASALCFQQELSFRLWSRNYRDLRLWLFDLFEKSTWLLTFFDFFVFFDFQFKCHSAIDFSSKISLKIWDFHSKNRQNRPKFMFCLLDATGIGVQRSAGPACKPANTLKISVFESLHAGYDFQKAGKMFQIEATFSTFFGIFMTFDVDFLTWNLFSRDSRLSTLKGKTRVLLYKRKISTIWFWLNFTWPATLDFSTLEK